MSSERRFATVTLGNGIIAECRCRTVICIPARLAGRFPRDGCGALASPQGGREKRERTHGRLPRALNLPSRNARSGADMTHESAAGRRCGGADVMVVAPYLIG
jgi:hypothetical protein